MAKNNGQWLCNECGWNGSKWYGRCPECQTWGSIEEFHEPKLQHSRIITGAHGRVNRIDSKPIELTRNADGTTAMSIDDIAALPKTVQEISETQVERITTGFTEFDRVLGGGIVPGSVVLIAGEPGVGKSTLLIETAGSIAQNDTVLYISGEESLQQISMRAKRVGATSEHLRLLSDTNLDIICNVIAHKRPALAIIDSVQTITADNNAGITGGSSQIREVTLAFIEIAKKYDIPIFLVGHVTKEGNVAGPRTLEHMVDVVCQFEGDSQTALRLLRAHKNRFGPTDEIGCFDMSGEGIEDVPDPSELFLSSHHDTTTEGVCVTLTLDGHRSLPIEVQALVTSSVLPTPRRATNGVDTNRLAMLVAVLYRHARVQLLSQDVYVSTIAGGSAKEPSADLAIALSLASAAKHIPIPRSLAAIGEISLTGEIRTVPRIDYRIREAQRLGFNTILVPKRHDRYTINGDTANATNEMKIVEISNIREAIEYIASMPQYS